MKKVICLLALSLALASCKDQGKTYVQSAPVNNAVVTPTAPSIGDNLNLAALGDLVKNSTSASEIETKLNSNGSINNLDLDGDENVDYIRVAEYGTGNNRGFSFNVDLPDGTTQKVADVDLINSGNGVQMNVRGNQEYYGSNYSHQSHYDMGDVLLMSYLLNNHRPYYSPYRYGSYPTSYRSYSQVPRTTYTKRVTTTTTTTRKPSSSSTYITPKYTTKSATTVAPRVNVAAPTTSQKSFTPTSTSASRPVTTGFKSTTPTSTYRPTTTSTSSYKPSTTSSYRPTSTSTSSYKPSSTPYRSTTSRPSTSGFSSSSYKPSSTSSYRPSSSSSSSRSSSSFGSSSRSSYSSSRSSSRR